MKIFKIEIENYRLLQNFSLELEDDLSLVIGKNNTGKSSILFALNKFLNQSEKNRITFDDFNIEYKKYLKQILESDEPISDHGFGLEGIKLRIFIEYFDNDYLANISKVMMDLDPNNNVIVLDFEYSIDYTNYIRMRRGFREFVDHESKKESERKGYKKLDFHDFMKSGHSEYFKYYKRSLFFDVKVGIEDDDIFIDIDKEGISVSDIINFKFISAKRDVTNKEVDKTLSSQTSRIYKRTESTEEHNLAVEEFKDKLTSTDSELSKIYKSLFNQIVEKIKLFGGIKTKDSEIEIISTLQHRELLEGNTTVVYKHDEENLLPEHYNGLGYMNLISMIFEIEILVNEFKREKDKKPSDINLLFIEEPEAHTHPQMQYVFIKNIKKLLAEGVKREDGELRKLQYIISTHSACIVADSDFDDIKYLKKDESVSVNARNLKELIQEYESDTKQYQFLRQYLTISRAEIFFADKAVLIEGDTERILIPTIMRKIDIEEAKEHLRLGKVDEHLPLLSQNVSIIEVGAYSQIFEKFIDFLGIKALIITDIDTINNEGNKSDVASGTGYSNEALKFFFASPTLNDLKSYTLSNKLFKKVSGTWKPHLDGSLSVVYQTKESGYHARSFEDAFIHINKRFINDNKDGFRGLQKKELFENGTGSYELAEKCIKKKTHFALDIIYFSNSDFSNWEIPSYIKEGLLWLKKD